MPHAAGRVVNGSHPPPDDPHESWDGHGRSSFDFRCVCKPAATTEEVEQHSHETKGAPLIWPRASHAVFLHDQGG